VSVSFIAKYGKFTWCSYLTAAYASVTYWVNCVGIATDLLCVFVFIDLIQFNLNQHSGSEMMTY